MSVAFFIFANYEVVLLLSIIRKKSLKQRNKQSSCYDMFFRFSQTNLCVVKYLLLSFTVHSWRMGVFGKEK